MTSDPKTLELIQEFYKQEQEKILNLLRDGKTRVEIANIMGVTYGTISKRIRKMDPKEVEKAYQEGYNKRRQKEICIYEKQEEKQEEKREEEQEEKQEKEQPIKAKKGNKKQQKNQEKIEEGLKILRLRQQGKKQKEIAEIMGVSISTVCVKLRQMKAKPNYSQLKQKLKEHTITRDEIDDYRDYLDDKYDKIDIKEVLLMSNMYIKTKRTSEAIKFLNLLIGNEDMEYLGKEKLIEARSETERIGKIQKVRELVKNNRSISEIMVETGLKEIEVIRIRNQIQGDREI